MFEYALGTSNDSYIMIALEFGTDEMLTLQITCSWVVIFCLICITIQLYPISETQTLLVIVEVVMIIYENVKRCSRIYFA